MLPEKIKNLDYTAGISPSGSLVLAGYTQSKQTFRVGDVESNGIYIYNTDQPASIQNQPFEKSIANMKTISLTFNNGTLFLTGEQISKEREKYNAMDKSFDENFNYKYGNIVITGYDMAANTKYDLVLTRKFAARNFITDLTPATGIINGKYHIIYNDELKKYVEMTASYKVPVTASITNEGLLEQPAHYEKEFNPSGSGYTLLTGFNNFSANEITVLLWNGTSMKAATFK